MNKQELRNIYRAKRAQLSASAYNAFNQALFHRFCTLSWADIKCLHIFLPVVERKEPDTLSMIAWLKHQQPETQIVYPKTNAEALTITSYADDGRLVLENNAWNITEPVQGTKIDDAAIDMVILPLLAFDRQGYRVGYGKGFYDRFLAKCRPGVITVGLCFFDPVERITDIDNYDVKMTCCLTPNKVWMF